MYPNLSYILEALFGTEPDGFTSVFQTFGLFLGLAFAASAYFLFLELKRKESEGLLKSVPHTFMTGEKASTTEIVLAGIVGFIIGYKAGYLPSHFEEVKADMVAYILSTKGALLPGLIFGGLNAAWAWYDKQRFALEKPKKVTENQWPHQRIMDFTFVCAVASLIGAKLFAIFETPDAFRQDFFKQLFSGSGMAIYGGLIGGFIGGYWYTVKRLKINPIHVMDAIAPSLMMGYAVGRMGCQFSGDGDWGIPVIGPNRYVNSSYDYSEGPSWIPDWLWSQSYPHNVSNAGKLIDGCEWEYCHELVVPVFPTPIYETVMALAIFGILWALRKRIKVPGVLFFIYMIFNGVERFFIEKIRVNDILGTIGGIEFSQAELISVLFFIVGIIGIVIMNKRAKTLTP